VWLDRLLFRLLHHRAGELGALDRAVLACARFGSYAEVALMLLAGLRGGQRGRRAVVRCLAAVGSLYLLAELIGRLVGRARPFAAGQQARKLVEHGPARSFPSRHVASAAAMAVITGPAAPRLAAAMGWLAAGLGLARIRVGLHYPADVLAGALLGLLVGRLLR
jgi:undecaprenyl-diphosphatase